MKWIRVLIVFTLAAAALSLLATSAPARAAATSTTAAAAVAKATAAAPEWSAPQAVYGAADFTALSCPSANFCMAADAAGNVFSYNGTSWTGPSPAGHYGIASLWCTSSTFCVTVDIYGYVLTWDGSAWSVGAQFANSLDSVWCGATCFAASTGAVGSSPGRLVYQSSGSTWLPTGGPGLGTGAPMYVSGPGTGPAALAISGGTTGPAQWATFTGGAWSAPQAIANMLGVTALSCFGQDQCLAVATGTDGKAYYTLYNGASWSSPAATQSPDEAGLSAVSCVSSGFCVAGDTAGGLTTWDNGPTWSAPDSVDPVGGITGVSCVSTTYCVAVDNSGHFMIDSVPPMTVSGVSPGQVTVGALSVPVVITGNGFTPGSPVSVTDSNPGVTFSAATAVSDTTIDATAAVAATAATGGSSVTVAQSGGTSTCSNCLAVAGLTITGLSVPQLAQGVSHPATITGTGFLSGAKIVFTGPGKGVTATVTSVTSTGIGVTIKVARTAPPGQYAVTVYNGNGAGMVYLQNVLTVLTAPTITALSSPTVTRGQSYFSFTITGTGFSSDATVKVPKGCHFGFDVISTDGTTITGSLNVYSSAPLGTNLSVTVTNGPNGGYGKATDPGLTIT